MILKGWWYRVVVVVMLLVGGCVGGYVWGYVFVVVVLLVGFYFYGGVGDCCLFCGRVCRYLLARFMICYMIIFVLLMIRSCFSRCCLILMGAWLMFMVFDGCLVFVGFMCLSGAFL